MASRATYTQPSYLQYSRKPSRPMKSCCNHPILSRGRIQIASALLIILLDCCISGATQTKQQEVPPLEEALNSSEHLSRSLPANHRTIESLELEEGGLAAEGAERQGRQYEIPMSTSGSGNYAAVSSDGAAYVGHLPTLSSGYNYAMPAHGELTGGAYHHTSNSYQDPLMMGRGFPVPHSMAMHSAAASTSFPSTGLHHSSMFSPSGFGGASAFGSMLPLMAKGFDVSEVVCTAVAVAIGAVIIGAPFLLIYIFVMNQINGGNGPAGMGSSGGAISLTGPTASTTVNGRRKRHASFSEALFKQLSPLISSEQVATTFKTLMSSLAKYQ